MSYPPTRRLSKREIRTLIKPVPRYEEKMTMLLTTLVMLAGSSAFAAHALAIR